MVVVLAWCCGPREKHGFPALVDEPPEARRRGMDLVRPFVVAQHAAAVHHDEVAPRRHHTRQRARELVDQEHHEIELLRARRADFVEERPQPRPLPDAGEFEAAAAGPRVVVGVADHDAAGAVVVAQVQDGVVTGLDALQRVIEPHQIDVAQRDVVDRHTVEACRHAGLRRIGALDQIAQVVADDIVAAARIQQRVEAVIAQGLAQQPVLAALQHRGDLVARFGHLQGGRHIRKAPRQARMQVAARHARIREPRIAFEGDAQRIGTIAQALQEAAQRHRRNAAGHGLRS